MPAKKKESFASKMRRLEAIVEKLESDKLELEESIGAFEQGVKLTKECANILSEAEKKVEILLKDQKGNVTKKAFDPALDDEEDGLDQ